MALTRRDLLAAMLAVPALSGRPARAGSSAPREVTWLIYQAPGGTVDIATRVLQPFIERAGVKTRLEYAQGAGGRVARTRLFGAPPDGSTIMTEVAPGAVIDEAMVTVPYKVESFEPIYGWANNGFHYCVKSDSPLRNFSDLVAETKKRRVTVGTIGRGNAQHLHVVAMRSQLGLSFDIVHFDGSSPAYAAVLGGHVDVAGGGAASGRRQGERLRFIGVTGPGRESVMPEVPSLHEQGFQVTPVNQIYFISTSPGVPADRVAALSKLFGDAVADPALVEKMRAIGESVVPLTGSDIKTINAQQRELVMAFKDELKR